MEITFPRVRFAAQDGIPFIQPSKQKGPSVCPQIQHSDISNIRRLDVTKVRNLPFNLKRSFSVTAANLNTWYTATLSYVVRQFVTNIVKYFRITHLG